MTVIGNRYLDFTVVLISTESEFRTCTDSLVAKGECPLMVISDVMLPWSMGTADSCAGMPTEVREGTFRAAGTRCWSWFRRHEPFRSVPWLYYTVLEKTQFDFAGNSDVSIGFVSKASPYNDLFEAMDELFQSTPKMTEVLLRGLKTPLTECITGFP